MAEAELRWQVHPQFSLVGFGGAGIARSEVDRGEREKTVTAGGACFRYLIAREYGLHMGLDVGYGPDGPILYVVFGSAWCGPDRATSRRGGTRSTSSGARTVPLS